MSLGDVSLLWWRSRVVFFAHSNQTFFLLPLHLVTLRSVFLHNGYCPWHLVCVGASQEQDPRAMSRTTRHMQDRDTHIAERVLTGHDNHTIEERRGRQGYSSGRLDASSKASLLLLCKDIHSHTAFLAAYYSFLTSCRAMWLPVNPCLT